ncbi:hypothetical protein D5R81_19985 [Parashewanella spongiae]|uniref:Uncharacterized protein n=1 Tax=Parashewanella spongiae TaxID=342950 RepID=A0A3A6T956_9GAMM|nr:hypothetical protein [Parashewanella spongiae]MCL1080317.1 hypothetical protein [Parashewanella spongiae]RJY01495.1 hypothetical protein D5R81_19985 [Parashewanella spongiae]
MKAVHGFKHLYLRKNTYYFRLVLRRHRTKFQIILSLQTTNLSEAVVSLGKVNTEISRVKKLITVSSPNEVEAIRSSINGFKQRMQKQLQMHHLDSMVAEMEQSFNNTAHVAKLFSNIYPHDFPPRFELKIKELEAHIGQETYHEAVHDFVESLSNMDKQLFAIHLSNGLMNNSNG